jgi:predicted Zn finger-like uncharacterized protein
MHPIPILTGESQMIIQCEQCRTKFKLDDSKVPDKGVKVRCAKCRYVFTVVREQSEEESRTDFDSILATTVSSEHSAAYETSSLELPEETYAIELDASTPVPAEESEEVEHEDMTASEPFEIQEEPEETVSIDTGSSEFGLFSAEEERLLPLAKSETPDSINDVDFGEFDFGTEEEEDTLSGTVTQSFDFGDAQKNQEPEAESHREEFSGLDFSGDDMFGEVVPSAPEESADAVSFDFGMDDFASSMGVENSATGQKNSFTMADASSDTPFSLDEIDFGDELTSVGVQHVSPEELKPSQELLFAPLAEAQQAKPASPTSSAPWDTVKPNEEQPPLSIASRRKQSPLFSGLVAILGIVIVGVVAYFGYSMFAGGKANVAQESGRISILEVDATFVKNKLTGDLLVITGEAVNDFNKPRAAIQVKGLVYGANGEVLSSKNAFCGNPLTGEQLATMSLDKIETAMANQFGDSLANMEVAPGKSIPFVIVIAKPPAGAKDYGVEPAGSTVATGKQQ